MIGSAESGDGFGSALAAGDFIGSGWVDLAVGVPYETVDGIAQEGFVNVLYSAGSTGPAKYRQPGLVGVHAGLAGASPVFARFGAGDGDFDGSQHDSLAVGAPAETIGGATYAARSR